MSVRNESLDLSGFLVIHCDVCSLPCSTVRNPYIIEQKSECIHEGARRGGRLPSLVQEQYWLLWNKTAVLLHSRLSDCFRTRTRQMRARVEVPREYTCCQVFIQMPVKAISIYKTSLLKLHSLQRAVHWNVCCYLSFLILPRDRSSELAVFTSIKAWCRVCFHNHLIKSNTYNGI